MEFINITPENIENEHLCCIIRKGAHAGVDCKRAWLQDRLKEGHVFRKAIVNGCAFIEYAPLETSWVPIEGDNFYYIYCLWITGSLKGQGFGKELLEYCVHDAKQKGKSGICMLGADKQKSWLSDQAFAEKHGFCEVDETPYGYKLLSLSFDGTNPKFSQSAKSGTIANKALTVYYSDQCPFILQRIEKLSAFCAEKEISADFIHVNTLEKAKNLPCVFNNWALLYNGKFVTVNQIDGAMAEKLIKRG